MYLNTSDCSHPSPNLQIPFGYSDLITFEKGSNQRLTDNSWGPQAIGDHGVPVSLPTLKAHTQKPIKGNKGISWGPLLTPGPRAVPECSNGQSTPASNLF
ncbi:unnamed protein product, partial [Staurois parvus]